MAVTRQTAISPDKVTAMSTNEPLDARYEHLPPHIRKVAIKIAQQIALTAEPVKTTLEATFMNFSVRFSCTSKSGNSGYRNADVRSVQL